MELYIRMRKKMWKEVPQVSISARYGAQMLRAIAELATKHLNVWQMLCLGKKHK
jgi:hypothetical protein